MSKRKHIAVTGTNGKSTVLRILQHSLILANKRVWGSYGTEGRFFQGRCSQKLEVTDAYFDTAPCDYMLTEASSFLLARGDYADQPIDSIIFTGFEASEHSELHPEKEDYWAAKLKVFETLEPESKAIICRDGAHWAKLPRKIKKRSVSYGVHAQSKFRVSDITTSIDGTKFVLTHEDKQYPCHTLLIGAHNAMNFAAAVACLVNSCEFPVEAAVLACHGFGGFKGRNNVIQDDDRNVTIVIDHAHTPDSLTALLTSWREIADGRSLHCIFGCDGNSSKNKRRLMGRVAHELADHIILTNDNPMAEAPLSIVEDIKADMSMIEVVGRPRVRVHLDRALAIKLAVAEAENAVIVIAGKGNENSVEVQQLHIPHIDWDAAVSWLISNNKRYHTPHEFYWD